MSLREVDLGEDWIYHSVMRLIFQRVALRGEDFQDVLLACSYLAELARHERSYVARPDVGIVVRSFT